MKASLPIPGCNVTAAVVAVGRRADRSSGTGDRCCCPTTVPKLSTDQQQQRVGWEYDIQVYLNAAELDYLVCDALLELPDAYWLP